MNTGFDKEIATSLHPPTIAVQQMSVDDVISGCVACDVEHTTHPDMGAVDAGFDPAFHH